MRGPALFIAVSLVPGCGPSLPDVVEGHAVPEAGGAPGIDAILDLGGRTATHPGPLRPDGPSDGVAAIGELVWLRGDDLGRMPRITIGGRPATAEAFTTAGLVVRVPPGVPAGEQVFLVEHSGGRAQRKFTVRRWALVMADGKLHPVAVGAGVDAIQPPIEVPGARSVRLSADGAAAYVLGDQLTVVDVAAQDRPRVVARRELPFPAEHVVVARDRAAGRGALVSPSTVVMLDLTRTYQPAYWTPQPLPDPPEEPFSHVEMDDSGMQLALLAGNRVVLVDVADVSRPRVGRTVDLLPDTRQPLGTHLCFARDDVFWVLSGDNARSRAMGTQPLRLLRVRGGAVDTTRELGAGAPAGLTVAPEARRIAGSMISASAMVPLLVAYSGSERRSAVVRVDGDGVEATIETESPLLAMAAAPGAVLAATCHDGRLGIQMAGGKTAELEAPCPEALVMVIQP